MLGYVINSGEVGFARVLGWRADADEDDFTATNSFSGVGSIGNILFPDDTSQYLIQMFLIERNFAGLQ